MNKSIYTIKNTKERLQFLTEQTIRITGLKDFGKYISILVTIDAIFLNEDRHTHNIAVLLDSAGEYHYCPIFDNGAALLSDIKMDYPLNVEPEKLIKQVKSKTFCPDFDEQLDIAEELYGKNIHFRFSENNLQQILTEEAYYPQDIKERISCIILSQRRKYRYLFE